MFLIILIGVIFMISLILVFINFMFSKKSWEGREKISSFECGFIPLSSSRLPFSINFYLISILFLIFDIEIVFLFPVVNLVNLLNLYDWNFMSFLILMILYAGLEFEKKEGTLKWML